MTFTDVVLGAASNREFVANIDRLKGTAFSRLLWGKRDPLASAIDEATGWNASQFRAFARIVLDLVWLRLPRDVSREPDLLLCLISRDVEEPVA